MQVHLGEGELRHFAELKPASMRGKTGGFGRDRLSEYAWYALRIDVHMCSSLQLATLDFKSYLYVPSLGQQEPSL